MRRGKKLEWDPPSDPPSLSLRRDMRDGDLGKDRSWPGPFPLITDLLITDYSEAYPTSSLSFLPDRG
jgi:hypothetical protein